MDKITGEFLLDVNSNHFVHLGGIHNMRLDSNSLFKSNKHFRLFWSGQTISMFGSQITVIGLPLTAVYLLGANPFQMGLFQAMATIPFFIFSLFAGVWIDQNQKKPLLILSNLLTAFFLLLIPLFAWLGMLNFFMFYFIVFLSATFSMVFELAYLSFLPVIVKREDLSDGNSKLEISRSIAQVSGPSVAGVLISVLTAPIAILIDSISYIVSTIFIWRIKAEEPKPIKEFDSSIFKKIGEGMGLLVKHPILRSISASTAILNFFRTAFDAVYIFFIIKVLGINPTQIGIIFGVGSIGGILGAFFSRRISEKFGIGPSIIGSVAMVTVGSIIVPFANEQIIIAMTLLILGQIITGFGNTVYFVSQVSLRQSITPMEILGRVNASNRFISRGAMPLGGIFGGLLGTFIELRLALLILAIGYILAILWLSISPVRKIQTIEDADGYRVQA
ncbi:MFS transporter [Bacillus sp. DJP31]|uniref:MFS transporter n=1 Tax=Bacillus sp. DJP31 TaxID=3409789 RepID=UPI003BB66256